MRLLALFGPIRDGKTDFPTLSDTSAGEIATLSYT